MTQLPGSLRHEVDALLARLARLHAASAHLSELADSIGREGSKETLLGFLDTLERDLGLAALELARVRAAARQ